MVKKIVFWLFLIVYTQAASSNPTATNSANSLQEQAFTPFIYSLPANSNIIGQAKIVKVEAGDTISSLAYKYDMGYQELLQANPELKDRPLRVGHKIIIPSAYILPARYNRGIVINLPELRLYYFMGNNQVMTFPVGLGGKGWRTPQSMTYVLGKKLNPTWHVPESIRAAYYNRTGKAYPRTVAPGPNNPLGRYAIYLGLRGYLIHSTINPDSVGRYASSGCIRMYSRDIAHLFAYVKGGTPVAIVDQPAKIGWQINQFYLEINQPLDRPQNDSGEIYADVEQTISSSIGVNNISSINIDWNQLQHAIEDNQSLPVLIGDQYLRQVVK